MAITKTLQSAQLNFQNIAAASVLASLDDVHGSPNSVINYMSGLTLGNYDLKTANGSPSATSPVEIATTQVWGDIITASGTSHTIDLTALPRTFVSANDDPLDLSGLKLQGFILQADFANTDEVVMVPGALNGYNVQNDASTKITVTPGGVEVCFFPENTSNATGMPAVAAADAEIDFSSAMSNFIFTIILFAG